MRGRHCAAPKQANLKEVNKMTKNSKRITLYKQIWARIRYWQNLRDVSDAELASYLQVGETVSHKLRQFLLRLIL